MSTSYKGSCVCGAIQLELTGGPKPSIICYCKDCRKSSGNLGQILSAYDSSSMKIIDAEMQLGDYVLTNTKSGKPKHKQFCKRCGCTIQYLSENMPGKSIIVTTLVEGGFEDFTPIHALFEDKKDEYTKNVPCPFY
ncbi:putative glutathione-dependent formaldehyde-activating enzyme [Clavispora lusitaniae]|uniref:Glutathione-dependent formaldehyde-activating enzyme n=1 Tax=Clavispora lusitaniae TaxID=36911 RepID=A0ACD0WSN9_CLALS|nr:hypothetical protein E0198_004987 [Clavispora lusitaniae]QFZ30588.1 putative glutathione-dependent formaldehyde-activating enzyme [Clavispora lusitaniae]QFZ36250.1 putative glutathione-dependent formaldehyde-activating enzyme [Clavispora lusitaniae]QFZ41934.1 putative glutathione-dependent formaldehyde-activating enzyme [Clavispora lusitaniae]QFZ47610.1 putative glutathione-dependent formaldehyde-activating enzyme [Clavispora lusitaniae]